MALFHLDGAKETKVFDAKFIGYLGAEPTGDFDLGGMSMSEFANSGHKSVTNAIEAKKNPTKNLQALISHIDSEIENPNFKGFKSSYIDSAINELRQWANHDAANGQQSAQINNFIAQLSAMKQKGATIGWSPIPGMPTQIYFQATNPTEVVPGILWKGTDTTQATPRIFWFWNSPMGIFQSHGYAAPESQGSDQAALQDIFNQVFGSINGWIKANGFQGSGNVQNAENQTGYSKFNLAANSADGMGGYLTGLVKYANFLNLITNPNFKVTNESGLSSFVKSIGKDISAAAKDVSHVVQQVAKTASKVVNTVIKDVKTIALAPARDAFLGLVAANVFGLASSFAKLSNDEINAFWGNFAPNNPTGLQSYVNKGKSHKPIAGPRRISGPELAAAVAVPILTAAIAYLKSKGVLTPAEAAAATAGVNAAADVLTNAPVTGPGSIPGLGPPTRIPVPVTNGVVPGAGIMSESSGEFFSNPWVLGGLGVLALGGLLLISKKD